MNIVSEQEFLANVLGHLARNSFLTLGEIRNKTRAFRRKRRISAQSVFSYLNEYVERGFIKQIEVGGRIAYSSRLPEQLSEPLDKKEITLPSSVGMGTKTMQELVAAARETATRMANSKKYASVLENIKTQQSETIRVKEPISEEEWKEEESAAALNDEIEETDPLVDLEDGPKSTKELYKVKKYEPKAPPPPTVDGFK